MTLHRAVNGDYKGKTATSHDSSTILLALINMGLTLFLRKALDEESITIVTLAAQVR